MNTYILKIVQIILIIFVIGLILIQSKGKGLAQGVGGAISMYRSRRGIEKLVFFLTIIFIAAFVTNSLLLILFA